MCGIVGYVGEKNATPILINALKKISADPNPVRTANKASASMYIVNPLKNKERDSLLSTHPTTANRIKRLENIH